MKLKEKMESYAPQPDPEVWDRIQSTLHRRRALRRAAIGTSAAALAVAAALLILPHQNVETRFIASHPEVAQTDIPVVETSTPLAQTEIAPSPSPSRDTAPLATPEHTPSHAESGQAPSRQAEATSQLSALPATVQPHSTPTPRVATRPVSSHQQQAETHPTVAAEKSQAPTLHETTQPAASVAPAQPAHHSPATTNHTPKTPIIADPETVPELMIPTAFAPDAPEEEVRQFRLTLRQGFSISHYRIHIFNRRGQQVFYSTDINLSWDGTARGVAMPMGTYVYKLEYQDTDGNLKLVAGTVTLVR